MADLEANMMHFQLMHESLSRFSESFASFLYGLNMNAFCVDFPEGPVAESFRRDRQHVDLQAANPVLERPGRGDDDGETTFMTTDTSFIDNPPPSSRPVPRHKPSEPSISRVPAPSARGAASTRGTGDGRAFIKASTTDSYIKINEQVAAIKSLSGKGIAELQVVGPEAQEGAIPNGCAVFVLTADLSVFLELGSRLNNIDAEIKKIQAKLQKSQGAAKKQQELMSKDGFEDKVSDVVLTTERKKLADAQSAAKNYEKTIEQFQKMKLSSA
ncbi:Valine--tRNA ligase like protein [Verticillium longisporum]|nr:Valine--tRNA ligase like protein [Verticillium longisporum]